MTGLGKLKFGEDNWFWMLRYLHHLILPGCQ